MKGHPNVTPRCQHCIMFACDVFSDKTSHFVLVEGSTILTMYRYTLQQCVYIIQTYYENSRSLKNTLRKIRDLLGINNRPYQSENCPIWSDENSRVSQERCLHPKKVIVLCAFWANGIIFRRWCWKCC